MDEERIHFESKRAWRRPYSFTEGGRLVEPAQSIRHEEVGNESNRPIPLQGVLNTNIQIPLSTLLECIPNLRDDLAGWVNKERKAPLEEVECDYIEEGADKHNIALASWEGDASNMTLPVTHKNCKPIPSIVDGGSSINIISMRLYDEWNLPTMEEAPFSIKLVEQSRITTLVLVKSALVRIAGVRFLVAFIVMNFLSHSSSFSILL